MLQDSVVHFLIIVMKIKMTPMTNPLHHDSIVMDGPNRVSKSKAQAHTPTNGKGMAMMYANSVEAHINPARIKFTICRMTATVTENKTVAITRSTPETPYWIQPTALKIQTKIMVKIIHSTIFINHLLGET